MRMRWDPFAETTALRRALGWLLGPLPVGWAAPEPAVDLIQTREGLMVKAALPGVRPEDVEVQVRGDRLTIRAEARRDRTVDQYGWHIRERRMGLWQRTLRLPFRVDTRRAQAELADGILTVRLPRAEGFITRLKRRVQRALRPLRPPRRSVRVRVART